MLHLRPLPCIENGVGDVYDHKVSVVRLITDTGPDRVYVRQILPNANKIKMTDFLIGSCFWVLVLAYFGGLRGVLLAVVTAVAGAACEYTALGDLVTRLEQSQEGD